MRKYTVQEFTNELSSIISATYDDTIAVSGEVSNFSVSSARHIYFTLKDSTSALRVVYFKQDNSGVSSFIPKNGDKVEVLGTVSVYKVDGTYQLMAKRVIYQSLGDLYEQFIRLKEKLDKAGLFNDERKKKIKELPKHIALITSKNGAALSDFITTAKLNRADFDAVLYAVPVQGADAFKEIVSAIKKADETNRYDVIVLMRGGGSYDELSLFNNEQIALAIADAKTPILSAIGHERDTTIADFVADKRVATPTAAANILSEGYMLVHERLDNIEKKIQFAINNKINNYAYSIDKFEMQLSLSSPSAKVKRIDDSLTLISNKLKSLINNRLIQYSNRFELILQRLDIGILNRKAEKESIAIDTLIRFMGDKTRAKFSALSQNFKLLNSSLELLDPFNVLTRGYAVVRKGDKFITSSADISVDDIVDVRFKDGIAVSRVVSHKEVED